MRMRTRMRGIERKCGGFGRKYTTQEIKEATYSRYSYPTEGSEIT
jgi:hypothetical protein